MIAPWFYLRALLCRENTMPPVHAAEPHSGSRGRTTLTISSPEEQLF